MAKLLVLLLFGIVSLDQLGEQQVFASVRHHIEPVGSNVYYLQDYCNLPDTDLEQKYRHRRSSDSDDDHDHDHDHDHYNGRNFAQDIHQTVKYYASRGIKRAHQQIKRELESKRKWKQIFLDPVSQPSVVIRLWRPYDEYHREHNRILQKVARDKTIRCNLLLRMSANASDSTLNSLANSTIGAVVNFLKLNKKPWLNNYRLRIVTSDPNMTQYWLQGRKLATITTTTTTTSTTSISMPSSSMEASNDSTAKSIPVAIDLLTNPNMHPEPLQKNELEQIDDDQSKWLLVELETLNELSTSSDDKTTNEKDASTTSSSTGADNQEHDDTELVINLYTQSTKTVRSTQNTEDGLSDGKVNTETGNNGTVSITYVCPVGTFDCAGDGSQCIPSGLRCNGEDNCGNRFDELYNCGTVNLYYIFGTDPHHSGDYLSSDGFWFAVRILVLLFLVCLLLYVMSLLCRCCCDRKTPGILINGQSPMVYVRSGKSGASEPLLTSSTSSCSSGGFGPTAGRTTKGAFFPAAANSNPAFGCPPPSYFGNQSDNQKSNVNEYIYVNNNYGQPQGSTTVNTSVRPSRDNVNGGATAPPQYPGEFPPLYPNIEYPNYGGTNKN